MPVVFSFFFLSFSLLLLLQRASLLILRTVPAVKNFDIFGRRRKSVTAEVWNHLQEERALLRVNTFVKTLNDRTGKLEKR